MVRSTKLQSLSPPGVSPPPDRQLLELELELPDIDAPCSRWGNCDPDDRITLNIKLILVPEELMDYVIYHELCHLKEHHHGKAFYSLLDRVLPEWRERKQKLEEFDFG